MACHPPGPGLQRTRQSLTRSECRTSDRHGAQMGRSRPCPRQLIERVRAFSRSELNTVNKTRRRFAGGVSADHVDGPAAAGGGRSSGRGVPHGRTRSMPPPTRRGCRPSQRASPRRGSRGASIAAGAHDTGSPRCAPSGRSRHGADATAPARRTGRSAANCYRTFPARPVSARRCLP